MEKLKEPPGRTRYLSEEELPDLMLLNTGGRHNPKEKRLFLFSDGDSIRLRLAGTTTSLMKVD